MSDPRNFILNSEYPMNYVVAKYTAQIQADPNSSTYGAAFGSFAHGLPFTPLLLGFWSQWASFSTSYDIGVEAPTWSGGQPEFSLAGIGADSSNIYYEVQANTAITDFFFRLYALINPDYTGSITSTLDDSTVYKINSDFYYDKISAIGKMTSAGTYNHALGFIPQCYLWGNQSVRTSVSSSVTVLSRARLQTDNGITGELGGYVTTSNLTTTSGPIYFLIMGNDINGG